MLLSFCLLHCASLNKKNVQTECCTKHYNLQRSVDNNETNLQGIADNNETNLQVTADNNETNLQRSEVQSNDELQDKDICMYDDFCDKALYDNEIEKEMLQFLIGSNKSKTEKVNPRDGKRELTNLESQFFNFLKNNMNACEAVKRRKIQVVPLSYQELKSYYLYIEFKKRIDFKYNCIRKSLYLMLGIIKENTNSIEEYKWFLKSIRLFLNVLAEANSMFPNIVMSRHRTARLMKVNTSLLECFIECSCPTDILECILMEYYGVVKNSSTREMFFTVAGPIIEYVEIFRSDYDRALQLLSVFQ